MFVHEEVTSAGVRASTSWKDV